ncbi:translesion error-prone DNA polymerase V autoproteolytic subunit [Vreelandella gomseomensis]|uniref:Translesion error-prone DNA polymerase V autoproteolytic subunit n=1 Tax=Vreelandella gomseomensis TaxID=370766 RepID=A0ABU1G8D0_9GAMM|nr:translesion error-prone DNA polymerase V autoproteolytic subunit [Halomonas gomseomensis]MDR5873748.1 translesion error-prone DNA polymerase V autoproteolytic subunit [Halomonas gomseomensis]
MSLPVSLLGRADAAAPSCPLPLYSSAVRAGFPSPADDHLDTDLDLHQYVVKRPAATYFVRSEGDSMTGDGIHHGDLLVVDRSLDAVPGRIVVICVDGELTVKRLERVGQRTYLKASNPAYPPIPIDGRESHVWGVVTHVLHSLPGAPLQ